MKPLTIIIPVRNCEKFVELTLRNILPANSVIDVLVADGGSIDSTLQIIDKYRLEGLSIRVISESDKGQSNALNKLLREVQTKFFIWLNADDIVLPEFIAYVVETINAKSRIYLDSLISITSNSIIIDSNGEFVGYQYCLSDSEYLTKNGIWFGKFPCRAWNTEMAKQCGGLNEELNYCMDFDFLRRQYIANSHALSVHSREFLGGFRHHAESKTGNPHNTPLVVHEMISLLAQSPSDRRWFRMVSILLRVTNYRYMYYRFLGRLGLFKNPGIALSKRLRCYG